MPDADTVWLTPLDELLGYLDRAGLTVAGRPTGAHRTVRWRIR